MDWYAELVTNGTGIWWSIRDKHTSEFVGAGGFNKVDRLHEKAEIGFWELKEYWGQGILKEVMPKLFEYGFTTLQLNRIEGYVESENIRCKKALEKIKFTHEATLREAEVKNGKKIDLEVYGILKSDFRH